MLQTRSQLENLSKDKLIDDVLSLKNLRMALMQSFQC